MIIVYNRTTGEIVGHCSRVFDAGKWREATIDELFPRPGQVKPRLGAFR